MKSVVDNSGIFLQNIWSTQRCFLIMLMTEASSEPSSADVNEGFTDAVDTEPLGVASVDVPKPNIPKSSSADIPAAAATAASSSLKTSSGFSKVWSSDTIYCYIIAEH